MHPNGLITSQREEQLRKEMERQNRERRKEEERQLREKQREEERFQREQRKEIERREKFLQKESRRVSTAYSFHPSFSFLRRVVFNSQVKREFFFFFFFGWGVVMVLTPYLIGCSILSFPLQITPLWRLEEIN
jgi:uncharacterized membrane protein YdbT with pleckstrin-like domain